MLTQSRPLLFALCMGSIFALAQPSPAPGPGSNPPQSPSDPVGSLESRLELSRSKAIIKGLTQFGDRRQGTDRSRATLDWIESQLKANGYTNIERIRFDYEPPAATPDRGGTGRSPVDPEAGPGGSRRRG